ncbi:ATP-binding protein [Candidatus Woesearchaeota archaeon]|nr:ATP-binding protein [Candidatus Woesearchaeota archaeon]
MIIHRPEETKRIEKAKKWVLVYGRRKTGKTFIINNFIKFDEYFFIKADRGILTKDAKSINYETFIEILRRGIEENKVIVIDEFHRLGKDFFDFLHYSKKNGKIILISSTLFLSKKLISEKSALLGLFFEIPIGLISLKDTLMALKKFNFSKKEMLELAILLREPIAVDYFDEKKKARKIIAEVILGSTKTIPALIGEIFNEEVREISAVYDGILRAIAVGKSNSGEISNYLFSKRLIKKDDPSIIQQYLNNLISFGIINRLELFNKKKFVYKLVSPLSRIYYYADEKYNLSERKVSESEIFSIIDEIIPRIVEDNIREFLAEKHGLKESVIEGKDFEIDGCLLKFKKPETLLEVKWKKLKKVDIEKAEKNLSMIEAKNKILFVTDKKGIKSNVTIIDVSDLIK